MVKFGDALRQANGAAAAPTQVQGFSPSYAGASKRPVDAVYDGNLAVLAECHGLCGRCV